MSETTSRILSAAVLIPILAFSIANTSLYYIPMFLLGAIVLYLALSEAFSFADKGIEGKPFKGLGYTFGFIIYLFFYFNLINKQTAFDIPEVFQTLSLVFYPKFEPILPTVFLLFMLSYLMQIVKRPLNGAILSVTSTVVSVMYVAIPLGTFLSVLSLKNGIYYVWFAAGLTMVMDGGAYFGGRWFGKHPAGLQVSPKKTIEGYVMGLVVAVLYAFGLSYFWENVFPVREVPFGTLATLLFSILLSFVTVLGDLAESAMKRDAKVKDSSAVVPGHGGTLDVIDAMLFTIPTTYFYVLVREGLGLTI
jgi:phosphatidate cytidylyltransferase